jgi:2-polyprenyl-6-methoxyphenol hydroxylase-like FAD-dependent oxidoreductase
MDKINILVVGAGIAGLSFARACEQHGFKVTLIEKAENCPNSGAGICLPANAMVAFKHLGLDQEILNIARQVNSVEYLRENGKSLSAASLQKKPFNKAPFVALPRQELIKILRKGLKSKIIFNTDIDKFEQIDDRVKVLLNHSIRSKFYDLVVGADGISSPLRNTIFGATGDEDLGITTWRFSIDVDTSNIQPVYYLGNDTVLMFYPMSQSQIYVYAHVIDHENKYIESDPHEMINLLFAGYCDEAKALLTNMTDDTIIYTGRLNTVSELHFSQGRTVFIGDALHGCPPSLQQGAAMAVEDALVLTNSLLKYSIPNAIDAFTLIREDRIKWIVSESNNIIQRAIRGNSILGCILRNSFIRIKGPANMVAWKHLLNEDPFAELDMTISENESELEATA